MANRRLEDVMVDVLDGIDMAISSIIFTGVAAVCGAVCGFVAGAGIGGSLLLGMTSAGAGFFGFLGASSLVEIFTKDSSAVRSAAYIGGVVATAAAFSYTLDKITPEASPTAETSSIQSEFTSSASTQQAIEVANNQLRSKGLKLTL